MKQKMQKLRVFAKKKMNPKGSHPKKMERKMSPKGSSPKKMQKKMKPTDWEPM